MGGRQAREGRCVIGIAQRRATGGHPGEIGRPDMKPIDQRGETVVLLAYGPDRDSFKVKHKFRTAMKVNLATGASSEE